jgi:hypothetical protein
VSYGSNGNAFESYIIDGVVKVRNNNFSFWTLYMQGENARE